MESNIKAHVLRLNPGMDLKLSLCAYVKAHKIQAASIASAVGSLSTTVLRYADKKTLSTITGPQEIVSLSGTLGETSGAHIHLSISDSEGKTLGGHLGEGSLIHTTLEVVLLAYPELIFERINDPQTGYLELSIKEPSLK